MIVIIWTLYAEMLNTTLIEPDNNLTPKYIMLNFWTKYLTNSDNLLDTAVVYTAETRGTWSNRTSPIEGKDNKALLMRKDNLISQLKQMIKWLLYCRQRLSINDQIIITLWSQKLIVMIHVKILKLCKCIVW